MSNIRVFLFLEDFEVEAEIGIHASERGRRQRVLVSVEMEVEMALDDAQDRIEEAVDYDFLRLEISKLVAERRYNLQETLCRDILGILKGHVRVRSATVCTRKPDVYPDARAVGCRVEYRR